MAKISIIIPVYNGEKYIAKCIKSLLNQDYDDFELIIVDDGSHDKSYDICKSFMQFDKRIRVLHQKNKGVAAARNYGLDIASGKYVSFVDSDDYVDKSYVSSLLNTICKYGTLGVCGYRTVTEEGKCIEEYSNKGCISRAVACDELFKPGYFRGFLCNKIFYKKIIDEYGLRLNEKLRICEDEEFVSRYLRYVDKIVCSNHVVYNYVIREGSATNMHDKDYDYYQYFCDEILNVHKIMLNHCDYFTIDNIKMLTASNVSEMCKCVERCFQENKTPVRLEEYIKMIKQGCKVFIKSPCFGFRRKVFCVTLCVYWKFAWGLCKVYRILKRD